MERLCGTAILVADTGGTPMPRDAMARSLDHSSLGHGTFCGADGQTNANLEVADLPFDRLRDGEQSGTEGPRYKAYESD